MPAERFRVSMRRNLALVVALLLSLLVEDERLHHGQLELVMVTKDDMVMAPYRLWNKPTDATEIRMIDGEQSALDETYGQFVGWDDEDAFGQALLTYEDFNETIFDAGGCFWESKCCESRWIGTMFAWTSTARGISNSHGMLRIGT